MGLGAWYVVVDSISHFCLVMETESLSKREYGSLFMHILAVDPPR